MGAMAKQDFYLLNLRIYDFLESTANLSYGE